MFGKKPWKFLTILAHPKGVFSGFEVMDLCGTLDTSTPTTTNHVLDLLSCWNTFEPLRSTE